ncbi:hypothetical protein BCR42DRAFT_424316 [Absidia repens]|uniref:Uncharacterized protein n=1 Tax=Absidia repens TaxID=90262 RepID=A0A1X2I434_9FUNG|nr:hypothetical protein BCR42DRAFT_424316 [Absidia repens]
MMCRRQILILCTAVFLFVITTEAANCFCKKIDTQFTEDCCQGCHGDLRENGDTHCHFDEYSFLSDFNRCCDSYGGMARCTIG